MTDKTFQERLLDLKSHAKLLTDACDRFIANYDSDEVKNIGVRLRVIVGTGKGIGLLFELAKDTNDKFEIMALNQYGLLKISETDNETGQLIQEKEKRYYLLKFLVGCR